MGTVSSLVPPGRRRLIAFVALTSALFVAVVVLSLSLGTRPAAPGGVAVSLFPYQALALELTRGTSPPIPVTLVIPRGDSPHTYVPRPSDVETVSQASLVFVDGLHDRAIQDMASATTNADQRIVTLAFAAGGRLPPGFGVQSDHGHDDDDGHDHSRDHAEPVHAWLDPVAVAAIADAMAESLAEVFPEQASRIRLDLERLQLELRDLDREMAREAERIRGRGFLTFHSAFDVFAARYGLALEGTIQSTAGVAPTPRRIGKLRDIVRARGVLAIFTEPQLPDHSCHILADELGLPLFTLDPLGTSDSITSYPALIRAAMATLVEALAAP